MGPIQYYANYKPSMLTPMNTMSTQKQSVLMPMNISFTVRITRPPPQNLKKQETERVSRQKSCDT